MSTLYGHTHILYATSFFPRLLGYPLAMHMHVDPLTALLSRKFHIN